MVGKDLAAGTIRSTYGTLPRVLRTAEVDGIIVTAMGIDLPKEVARAEMTFLSPTEVAYLAEAIEPRYQALIYTAAYTGMRWGELAALRVERVNLRKGTIHVCESLAEVNAKLHLKSTKNGKDRTVSLPRFLAQMLSEHIGRYPSCEGHVFPSASGAPLRRRNFYRRHFRPAVEGVPERPKAQGRAARPEIPSPLPEDKRRLRFHDLRHTCAALLIAQGAHAKEIQERLGHSTIRLTFDRYGHLLPSLDERLRDGLEAVYQEARAACERPGGPPVGGTEPLRNAETPG